MTRHRTAARFAAAVAAAALACVTPLSAHAATTATDNWWWDTYDIGAVHAEGWTGEGVKVAVIDGFINPEVPALQGADVTVAEPALCDGEQATPSTTDPVFAAIHGTTIAAMIVGNGSGAGSIRGIAPGAELTFYGLGEADACVPRIADRGDISTLGLGVQRAIEDGARIITTSVDLTASKTDSDIIANAIAKGVVVISATDNPDYGFGGGGEDAVGFLNGIVSATAVNSAGELQRTDTSAGAPDGPFVVANTTVVAAGADLPTIGVEGDWNSSGTVTGSSLSAPLVAGMLAVVAQRYPDATGNQLVQSLVRNTGVEPHEFFRGEDGYGYGAAWLTSMLAVDPTQYPDENPLMNKSLGVPTAEQVDAAAARGSALPEFVSSFSEYGDDPGQAGSSSGGAANPLGLVVVVASVVLGVVVLGGVVTLIIVLTRKRRTPQEGTP